MRIFWAFVEATAYQKMDKTGYSAAKTAPICPCLVKFVSPGTVSQKKAENNTYLFLVRTQVHFAYISGVFTVLLKNYATLLYPPLPFTASVLQLADRPLAHVAEA